MIYLPNRFATLRFAIGESNLASFFDLSLPTSWRRQALLMVAPGLHIEAVLINSVASSLLLP